MEQMFKNIIVPLVVDYGIPLALVIFFVWRDYKREENLSGIIRKLEDEMRAILKDQVTSVTRALTNNIACMRELVGMLRTRPCIAEEVAEAIVQDKLAGLKGDG